MKKIILIGFLFLSLFSQAQNMMFLGQNQEKTNVEFTFEFISRGTNEFGPTTTVKVTATIKETIGQNLTMNVNIQDLFTPFSGQINTNIIISSGTLSGEKTIVAASADGQAITSGSYSSTAQITTYSLPDYLANGPITITIPAL